MIYGAGVVGCEYACIFSALGVDITVVDSRSRILQYLDTEIGNELQRESLNQLTTRLIVRQNQTRYLNWYRVFVGAILLAVCPVT